MNQEYVFSQGVLESEVMPDIGAYDILFLDLETRGLDARNDEILLMQLSTRNKNIWVLDVRKLNLKPLITMLSDINPLIVAHNAKFDLKFLKYNYDYMPKRIYCTMIANALINNGRGKAFVSLRDLVEKFADVRLNKDVRGTFKYTYGDLTQDQINYAAEDVMYMPEILEAQIDTLKRDNLIDVSKLEFDVLPAAIDMELNGILIDQAKWEKLAKTHKKKLSNLEMRIAKLLGNVDVQSSFLNTPKIGINLNSPKQVKAKFKEMGIDIEDTREDTLSKIDHPFAEMLLQHRELSKQASTYGLSFLDHVEEDGRIRSRYNQIGATTGRWSSSSPNLQNIPAEKEYRSCFIAEDGNLMITADFSQVELRTVAVEANEPAMLEEYKKKDADLHTLTASRIEGVPFDEVTPAQRSIAKSVNFGTVYGISKYGLYRKFNIPLEEGERFINGFFDVYPNVNEYMQRQGRKGISKGYNTTKLGRRKYFKRPPINDSEYGRKMSSIRRRSANFPIQGGAADIMKQAIVNVYNAIKPYDAKLINTVHDELSVEFSKDQTSEVVSTVIDNMMLAGEQIMSEDMRWKVGSKVGKYWMKA
jgi:DNA polymerase-1